MTNETINLIIEWFEHIEQLGTDRKTQTGVVMDKQHCLDEIAAMASRCKQFVEEYKDEQEPIDEEKLDKLAWNEFPDDDDDDTLLNGIDNYELREAFKAGFRKL